MSTIDTPSGGTIHGRPVLKFGCRCGHRWGYWLALYESYVPTCPACNHPASTYQFDVLSDDKERQVQERDREKRLHDKEARDYEKELERIREEEVGDLSLDFLDEEDDEEGQ